MSRHRLQLEAALLQGKTHLPLAHIYVNGAKKYSQQLDSINSSGASVNENNLSDDSSSSNGGSSPQTVPKSPMDNDEKGKTEEKKVITGKVESILESDIEAGRKSAEEILKQFPNYAVGTPSKVCYYLLLLFYIFFQYAFFLKLIFYLQVLYVKNLDNSITAQDLVSVFIRFQEEGKDKINFKIMDGKMKGQAFITFHGIYFTHSYSLFPYFIYKLTRLLDQETATKALNLVHGYVFKNKPMIIQYGKQK